MAGPYLVIIGQSALPIHYRLPEEGSLTIGRDPKSDIVLEDQRASRRHASLDVRGSVISISAHESANGTWLLEQRLAVDQPTPIAFGETITIGTTLLVVRRSKPALLPVRAQSHEAFELRLRQVCEHARSTQVQFSVARLKLDKKRDSALPRREVEEPASQTLIASDLLATYSDDDYELLLFPASPREAQARLEGLSSALGARGLTARTAIAHFPYHGPTADSLVAKLQQLLHGEPGPESCLRILEDPEMKRLYALVERTAASDAGVVIFGETGVGKNLLAEQVHRRSPRSAKPFLVLNCGALPPQLVESELFGHEKGAFTGAFATHKGLIEKADGGTVFLDEIGDLPLEIQVKLNHVLQSKAFRTVGGREVKVDVRFIAATHRNLVAAVKSGSFREDLYYRIAVLSFFIPPLRERRGEITPLALALLAKICSQQGVPPPPVTEAALLALQRHDWPGNVRELENVITRAMALSGGAPIAVDDLPETLVGTAASERPPGLPVDGAPQDERAQILKVLQACRYNQTKAAKQLGMQRSRLVRKLKKYGLSADDED